MTITKRITVAALLAAAFVACLALLFSDAPVAHAANPAVPVSYEVDLGVQALTPTSLSASSLTIPQRTRHAEFYVLSGTCYVRWNGSTPSAATGFPWPTGHMRKEANDGEKLAGFRALGDCELRVLYLGNRREQ